MCLQFVYTLVDGVVEQRGMFLAFFVQSHCVFMYDAEFFLYFHIVDEAGLLVVFKHHLGDAFVVAFCNGEGDDVVCGGGGHLEVGVEVGADAVDVAVHSPGKRVAQQFHEGDETVVELEFVSVNTIV